MNERPTIWNQEEAAEYINSKGIRMTGPALSAITNNGGGPVSEKKGNQKLFLKPDVDAWVEAQLRILNEGAEENPNP